MEKRKENKMGVMPVRKLIVTMSLPMMFSMLVQALYNIVDSIFVARVSESALTAVTLAFPLQNMMISLGAGTGVGINALLSRSLGAKRFEDSDATANTALLLSVFNYVIFFIVGLLFATPFIKSQTADPEISAYGQTYLRIVCMCSVGVFFQMTWERLLQSTGLTFYSMICQVTGAVINIIMDPMLIFGIGPFPRLGVAGAAYATIFGQVTASLIGLYLNLNVNKELHFSFEKILHPKAHIVKQIYYVGVPSILMMSIGSVMTYLMNRILIVFSSTATAVFGVYFKLQSFFFMPVFGLNNGLVPVLAYNYGARKKDRITEALRFSLTLAVCVMAIGTLVFELFPATLLKMFNASDNMLEIGVPALRIIGIHFPLAAVGIALGSVYQAFSKSIYSLIISLCRQLVVLVPVAWLLAQTGVLGNVWWAFLASEVVSLTLSIIFFKKVYREVVQPL